MAQSRFTQMLEEFKRNQATPTAQQAGDGIVNPNAVPTRGDMANAGIMPGMRFTGDADGNFTPYTFGADNPTRDIMGDSIKEGLNAMVNSPRRIPFGNQQPTAQQAGARLGVPTLQGPSPAGPVDPFAREQTLRESLVPPGPVDPMNPQQVDLSRWFGQNNATPQPPSQNEATLTTRNPRFDQFSADYTRQMNIPEEIFTHSPTTQAAVQQRAIMPQSPMGGASNTTVSPQIANPTNPLDRSSAIIGDTATPTQMGQTPQQTQGAGATDTNKPEATFTRADGTISTIMPGQNVQSAFPQNPNTPVMGGPIQAGQPTIQGPDGAGFQRAPEGMVKAIGPDGNMVFATPEQAQELNEAAAEQNSQDRQAQQNFLGSDAMKDYSNRMLQSVINSPYSQQSQAREQRIADRPDFGAAVSDRERRGTGEMSMAEATRMAGGDRNKARQMIEMQRQGLDPTTGRPTEPADNRTEEEIENQRLQNELIQKRIETMGQPNATPYQKRVGELSAMLEAGEITQEEYDAAIQRQKNKTLGIKEEGEQKLSATEALLAQGETGGAGESTEATQDGGSTPPASTKSKFTKGQRVKQNGVEFEFDGKNWNPVN